MGGQAGMKLYYRLREKGALVFRMEVANRQRRIELNRIATISADGEVTPHRQRPASDQEMAQAAAWWRDWCARRDEGRLAETERFMAQLNGFTDWMAREAADGEVAELSDPLLMALLDLRQVVVRRLSDVEADRPLVPGGGIGQAGG